MDNQDHNLEPHTFWRDIKPDRDQTAEYRSKANLWKMIHLPRLFTKEQFLEGDGYGRNQWNELYKGRTIKRLYARVPMELVESYNLVLVYQGRPMKILRWAQPDFEKPLKHNDPRLFGYFRWMEDLG